jgi:hypothetical protein
MHGGRFPKSFSELVGVRCTRLHRLWQAPLATISSASIPARLLRPQNSTPVLLAVPNQSRYIPDGPRAAALSAFFREFVPTRVLQHATAQSAVREQ